MPTQISIVIIDQDKLSRDAMMDFLKPYSEFMLPLASVDYLSDGARAVRMHAPNVVFLRVDELRQGLRDVQFITLRYPRASVIACSSEKNSEWILALMHAGAIEYLLRPIAQEELKLTLQKVGKFLGATATEEPPAGKIIAVYNPIGGMGATTLAVNLAAALVTKGARIALVDLNLHAGDISTFLNVKPTYTLSSVTANIERLDANFLMSAMTCHSCGLFLLTEPVEIDEAVAVTAEQVQRIMEILPEIFDYVIVDCAGQLAGTNLAIFRNSNLVLFTTTLSLPALKNARRYLSALGKKGFGRDRVKLVINRDHCGSGIQIKEAEKVLDRGAYQAIPNVYPDVVDSINKGLPVVKLLPRSPVSRAILGLAERVKQSLETI